MAITMFWSGKRMEEVEPLEMTVKYAETRHGKGFAVAFVAPDGEPQPMLPDFDDDECVLHGTLYAARVMALSYAKRWIEEQGLTVIYRSDREVLPVALAA